jgi:hypothetical protein
METETNPTPDVKQSFGQKSNLVDEKPLEVIVKRVPVCHKCYVSLIKSTSTSTGSSTELEPEAQETLQKPIVGILEKKSEGKEGQEVVFHFPASDQKKVTSNPKHENEISENELDVILDSLLKALAEIQAKVSYIKNEMEKMRPPSGGTTPSEGSSFPNSPPPSGYQRAESGPSSTPKNVQTDFIIEGKTVSNESYQ